MVLCLKEGVKIGFLSELDFLFFSFSHCGLGFFLVQKSLHMTRVGKKRDKKAFTLRDVRGPKHIWAFLITYCTYITNTSWLQGTTNLFLSSGELVM
jgi:hypothetical protein